MGHDHGLPRGSAPRDRSLGSGPRSGPLDRHRAREPDLPSRFRAPALAGCHRRPGQRRLPGRPVGGGRSLLRLPRCARRGGQPRTALGPGGEPGQGTRAGHPLAHDRGHQGGHARASGGRPHRAQHRHRDHAGQGRRRGDRHAGSRSRERHPEGRHPWCLPCLREPRRHRLRDGRCVEERHRHRRRHR